MWPLILLAAMGPLVAACESEAPVGPAPGTIGAYGFDGRLIRVVDGDTFWLDSRDVGIRVWGSDAPERGQPGGSEATAALTGLVARQLSCRERDIDRYGRIVGQCFLPDGRDIAAAMISNGSAREYCRFSGDHYDSR